MVTGLSGVNIERPCHSCQWGDVTFGGSPPHSVLETLRLRSGRTEFPSPGDGFRLGRSRLGGGAPSGGMDSCLRRKDGWGVAVWGGPRSTLRPASADLQHAQDERPLPGMDSGLEGGMTDGAMSLRFLAGTRDDGVREGWRSMLECRIPRFTGRHTRFCPANDIQPNESGISPSR